MSDSPFKPGDLIRHKGVVYRVACCYRAVHVGGATAMIVQSMSGELFFANDCEPLPKFQPGPPKQLTLTEDQVADLRKQVEQLESQLAERDEQIDDLQRQFDAVKRCHAKDQSKLDAIRKVLEAEAGK